MENGQFNLRQITRRQELAEVICGLNRGIWYVIYGPPGSGKTTFLAQLQSNLTSEMDVIYLNLRACSRSSLAETYGYLAQTIKPGSKAANLIELRELLLSSNKPVLLAIDDAASAPGEVANSLLNALSALHAESRVNPRLSRIKVVLAASKDLQGLNRGPLSCLNSFAEVYLRDFTLEELTETLGEQGREIWSMTEGHPWLSEYLARNFYRLGAGGDISNCLSTEEIPLFAQLKEELPDILQGYAAGRWSGTVRTRNLRISGLAKLQNGQLVVRNPIFRKFLELQSGCGSTGTEPEYPPVALTGLTLNRRTKEVSLDGRSIGITPVEFRILECLLANCPRVISKAILAEAAFPFEPLPSADVESHIKNIRRKLADGAKNPRYISCRRGFGYQAVAGSFELI